MNSENSETLVFLHLDDATEIMLVRNAAHVRHHDLTTRRNYSDQDADDEMDMGALQPVVEHLTVGSNALSLRHAEILENALRERAEGRFGCRVAGIMGGAETLAARLHDGRRAALARCAAPAEDDAR